MKQIDGKTFLKSATIGRMVKVNGDTGKIVAIKKYDYGTIVEVSIGKVILGFDPVMIDYALEM